MSADSGQYFVRRRGRVMGPFDIRRLERMLRRGNLNRGDQCSTDRREWSKLEDLEELFPPAKVEEPAAGPGEQLVDTTGSTTSPAEADWYYHHQGLEKGPVSEADIKRLVSEGVLAPADSVWKDGMADWEPVGSVFALPSQPGMVQPGMVQPGMVQPGMVQPGMAQPGMVQPGMVQPGMVQPGMVQPGMAQPGMVQPGMVQPTAQVYGAAPGGNSGAVDGSREIAGGSLIVCGYIFAVLFPLVGIVLGIVTITKGSTGHGVAHILISVFGWAVTACVVSIMMGAVSDLSGLGHVLSPLVSVIV